MSDDGTIWSNYLDPTGGTGALQSATSYEETSSEMLHTLRVFARAREATLRAQLCRAERLMVVAGVLGAAVGAGLAMWLLR